MLLTILEIWMACDECATQECQLLSTYDPELPVGLLQNLVLTSRAQLERLHAFEEYLQRRAATATLASVHVFEDVSTSRSFAVRYFEQSKSHQRLLEEIEDWAEKEKAAKITELQGLKVEYQRLMALHERHSCTYEEAFDDWGHTYHRHSSSCQKCRYLRQAEALTIEVQEHPLPNAENSAKAVVFELRPPFIFSSWREGTHYVLQDVLACKYRYPQRPQHSQHLSRDPHIARWMIQPQCGSPTRFGLLSQNKAHVTTHRRSKKVSTSSEANVCVENGLDYAMFDKTQDCYVLRLEPTESIPQECTYTLPSATAEMRQYLYRPAKNPDGPPPNQVIASQDRCPGAFTLAEYTALSSLPLGRATQWIKLLAELAAPRVDFAKVETSLVILQTIYQAGPGVLGTSERENHQLLEDAAFVSCLLDNLVVALERISKNWAFSQGLGSFVAIATRLLSVTTCINFSQRCLDLLRECRSVAFRWLEMLRDKALHAVDPTHRLDLVKRGVEIALICGFTLDVDENWLADVLEQDASTLIKCNVVVQEGGYTLDSETDLVTTFRYWRFQRLICRTYCCLIDNQSALDSAIRWSWASSRPSQAWTTVSDTLGHWITTNTGDELVHFNLLTGTLLVNGLPMDRLPAVYETHPSYRTLFGSSPIEVMPTSSRGMYFRSKGTFAEHTLEFGRLDGNGEDLLVKAHLGEAVHELVPARLFDREMPTAFQHEFVHWHRIQNGQQTVNFRPIAEPWQIDSPSKWTLFRNNSDMTWVLRQERRCLLALKGQTSSAVSNALRTIADVGSIHMVLEPSLDKINIEIPCLGLTFCLRQGTSLLFSKEYQAFAVDNCQSLGT